MKRIVIILIAVMMYQSIIAAEDSTASLLKQAEAAYSKGDFKAASELYQQLIGDGVVRSEIYFDLGNAYYQLHDLGRAMVNYRRAEVFAPRDEYLHLNLTRIRVQRVDGIMAEAGVLGQIAGLTSDWLSSSELGWIIIALLWFCCGSIAIYLWRTNWRKRVRWAILIGIALLIIISALGLTRNFVNTLWKPAVIVDDAVSVMTGPGTNYIEIFELHAATEICIMEERNGWVRFQLPDLRQGWIKTQSLEMM